MQRRRAEGFSLQSPPSVLLISIFIFSIAVAMAEGSSEASVHIIYTEQPPVDDAESLHLRTLTTVLGRSTPPTRALPSLLPFLLEFAAVPRGGCLFQLRIILLIPFNSS